ncbi:MAG: hypothetical protein R3Y09_07000 [Clostridia bacterium]
MLGLKYNITGSKLEVLEQNSITQNSRNQFECEFEFSNEWEGLTKFCVFELKDKDSVCVEIKNNRCVLATTETEFSSLKTGVFGVSEEVTYTTNSTIVFLSSATTIDAITDEEVTKSLYEQFILDAVAIRNESKSYAECASKSVSQYPKVVEGKLYFWDVDSQGFTQTDFTDGLSAYEQSVKQGFEGDIDEWIESLKGEKGDTGEQGIQGEKGDAFVYSDFTEEQIVALKGEQGLQGIQGQKGDTGDTYELTDDDRQEIAKLSQEEVTNARTSFKGEVQDTLDERINTDVAMLLDRFNSATTIPYEGEDISTVNSYLGMTSDLKIQGNTIVDENGNIESVSGSVEIKSSGKNLYPYLTNYEQKTNNNSWVSFDGVTSFFQYSQYIKSGLLVNLKKGTYRVQYSSINTKNVQLMKIDTDQIIGSSFALEEDATVVFRCQVLDLDLPYYLENVMIEQSDTVTDYEPYTENVLTYENIELRRIDDTYDCIFNNQLIQRIGTREYLDGDLELENVLVDNDITYYILDEPIITQIDTSELKTYDGATYIATAGSEVKPIISARIPSDVGAVIAEVSETNSEIKSINETLIQELAIATQTIDTLLAAQ